LKKAFINVKIYNTEKRAFEAATLYTDNGIICRPCEVDETVDCGGAYMIPGLVDVHTHGREGMDSSNVDADTMCKLAKSYANAGTTSFMATFGSCADDWYFKAIDNIVEANSRQHESVYGANIIGIHLEGRYICMKRKGAHTPEYLAPLNADELESYIDRMRSGDSKLYHFHTICAPELEGSDEFIKRAVSKGATVGIGHSDATLEICEHAMSLGARSFVHLYNAMSPMTHRAPGCVGAGLSSDAYTELICDGFHVDPAVVRVTYRAKASDRLVLITDSITAAGLAPGIYTVCGGYCDTRNGKTGLCADGVTINGSIIDLFTGMKNFMEFTGITLEEAIPYATINPARMVCADDEVGSLEVGKNADFLLLENDKATLKNVYVKSVCIK